MSVEAFNALVDLVKEHFDVTTQAEVAGILDLHQPQVANWLVRPGPVRKTWLRLFRRLVDQAAAWSVIPLVEFSEIAPLRSGNSWRFHHDKSTSRALKVKLDGYIGLYLFYDSSGRVVYVGKATTNLWTEAKQRLGAKLSRVGYMPKKKALAAGNVARYVSAYAVNPRSAIHNLEALLIRGFGNDHSNRNSANMK